jgi:sporulation protein YlmC with PRC-barrel domain
MDKTAKILVTLASVFCLVLLGGSVLADEYSQEFPGGTVGAIYEPMGQFDTFEASWLIGHYVTDAHAGSLGQISSFVIDNTNGRIALVVLSDVPGLGHMELAMPYDSIMRTGSNTFEFNPGDMVIEVAPESLGNWAYQDPYLYTVTRGPSDSEFFGLPSTITPEWVADVYRHYGQAPYWTLTGEKPLMSLELYDSGKLMGAEVETPKGEAVAEVNDLVIDSFGGHIAFVVLSNVAGRGEDLVAVPFGALSTEGGNVYGLNCTRDQLASARSFDEGTDMNNLKYATDIYMYFGLEPYWTDKGR